MVARVPVVHNASVNSHEPLAAADTLALTTAQVQALAALFGADVQERGSSLLIAVGSGTVPATAAKIIVQNGAAAVTLTLPAPATMTGKSISFSRAAGSTGAITILPGAGQIQALNGTMGATTTLGAHSAAGAGLDIQFWSTGTNWHR